MEGIEGAEILKEVNPLEGEIVLVKKRFGGFPASAAAYLRINPRRPN
jgi:hypothetical protein